MGKRKHGVEAFELPSTRNKPLRSIHIGELRQRVRGSDPFLASEAAAEIRRRGYPVEQPELNVRVSGHAIDRASQRILDRWIADHPERDIGLQSWIINRVTLAVASSPFGLSCLPERVSHEGMVWHIARTNDPSTIIVKTVDV
jgi:hypothetical protein